jgi:hypothetical protein
MILGTGCMTVINRITKDVRRTKEKPPEESGGLKV